MIDCTQEILSHLSDLWQKFKIVTTPFLSKQKQEQYLKQRQSFKERLRLALEFYFLIFLLKLSSPSNCHTFSSDTRCLAVHLHSVCSTGQPNATSAVHGFFSFPSGSILPLKVLHNLWECLDVPPIMRVPAIEQACHLHTTMNHWTTPGFSSMTSPWTTSGLAQATTPGLPLVTSTTQHIGTLSQLNRCTFWNIMFMKPTVMQKVLTRKLF